MQLCTYPKPETILQPAPQPLRNAAKASLSHRVHSSRLAIMTDGSDHGVGAVLQQKVDNVWKPLGFYSKAIGETQRRSSEYDRELLAMYTAVKHFCRLIIEGCEVEI